MPWPKIVASIASMVGLFFLFYCGARSMDHFYYEEEARGCAWTITAVLTAAGTLAALLWLLL